MKLRSIPQLLRNSNRIREIASVLIKYGLADWISRLGLEFAKDLLKNSASEALARQTRDARIRLALTELGPTFIKLGQILSTRADLVGVDLANELSQLQAGVRADSPETARAIVEAELGRPIEEVFGEFSGQAMASASIGQVHAARLKSGASVAVKVRHKGIEEKIRVDLEILVGVAMIAEMLPEFKSYRPRATVSEFQRTLKRELDFSRELRYLQQFARDFSGDDTVRIPKTYPEFSTSRVLTMERLEGVPLTDPLQVQAGGFDLQEVARRGAELYLTMIFDLGCYHADPHPGNIILLPGNVIGLVDFGMIGRIDEVLREEIGEMLLAMTQRDAATLTRVVMRLGSTPPDLDEAALTVDVADFVDHFAAQQLDEFDLAGALNELIEMIRRYRIMLPARVAMLLKVLVMLEGTSRLACPRFCLMEVMRPHQRKIAWRRLSPSYRLRKWQRTAADMSRFLELLPRGMSDILQQVQSGKFDMHLDHRGLEPSVNRLVLGMLTSALIVSSSLLLSRDVPPFIPWPQWLAEAQISLLGASLGILSILLGFRVLWAINKSGHLDRH